MKAEQEAELLGKTLEEETFGAAVNKLREELEKLIAPIANAVQVPAEILFGRKRPARIQGPPLETACMDAEITASDEELLAYFRGIMLQKRIDRMDMIERMTHAAASLSGRCQEEELNFFHVALRELGFDFNQGLIWYLRTFEWRLEHEAMPAQDGG